MEYKDKIKAIRDAIEGHVDDNDLEGLIHKLNMLSCLVGTSAETKARAIKELKTAELIAYAKIKSEKLPPTVMKIVIEGETADERARLEMADRLNAGLVHCMDGIRTIISLRKTELEKGI